MDGGRRGEHGAKCCSGMIRVAGSVISDLSGGIAIAARCIRPAICWRSFSVSERRSEKSSNMAMYEHSFVARTLTRRVRYL